MPHACIIHADSLDHLRTIKESSIDAIITDPPYGLSHATPARVQEAVTRWVSGERDYTPTGRGFMNVQWDAFVPPPALWDEALHVLKPGGHLACFAGARTHDVMTLAIRLAGFEIRDQITWLYGSGMPHGKDIGKSVAAQLEPGDPHARVFDGWSTALKPASEPIVLARKPLTESSVVRSVLAYGTGAINTGACRIAHADEADLAESMGKNRHGDYGTTSGGNKIYGDYGAAPRENYDGTRGRHPANVALTHSAACTETGRRSGGISTTGARGQDSQEVPIRAWDCALDCPVAALNTQAGAPVARFFYSAKAHPAERPTYTKDGWTIRHTTVKPLALIRWLVRLLTPIGGIVLDPFAGSGTTLEAAALEGFNSIAIEREADYIPLIEARAARVPGLRLL